MQATAENLPTLKPNPTWAKLPLFNRMNWARGWLSDVVGNAANTESFRTEPIYTP